MFKWLVNRATTLYGFLSGMFMSVATTALSNFALAPEPPTNLFKLEKSALLAFGAACGWFLLGEYVSRIKETISRNQDGIGGDRNAAYEKAIRVVGKDVGWRIYLLLFASIACSVLWPFV